MIETKNLPYSGNQKALLRLIYDQKGLTRSDLAAKTGFSLLTVTKFIAEFISDGIVVETDTLVSAVGRRPAALSINPDYAYVLAVDVGAFSTKIGIVKLNGDVIMREIVTAEKFAVPSKTMEPGELKDKLLSILKQYDKEKFLGLSIGISGLVDYNKKQVIFCPNIFGWNDLDVAEEFESSLHIPVVVDTSARCMALSEQKFGFGKDVPNMIFVSVGHSIGAGIISDSQLFRGAKGISGELGHVQVLSQDKRYCSCGNYGCLEVYVTLPVIINKMRLGLKNFHGYSPAKELIGDLGNLNLDTVKRCVQTGDKIIHEVLTDTGTLLGNAVSNMVNILNPNLVIFGGGVIENFPLVAEEAERTIMKRSLVPITQDLSIKSSSLGPDAPIIGCALQLINQYFYDQATCS